MHHRRYWQIACVNCGKSKQACRANAKYCNSKCQLAYEYATGVRDPKTIANAAHEAVRKFGSPKRKGKPIPWLHNATVYAKVSKTKTGKPVPKLQGPNSGNWRGGINKTVWKSREYQAWRKAVFRRDQFTCVRCGYSKGKIIEADHIKPRYLYPELTFDINRKNALQAVPSCNAYVGRTGETPSAHLSVL